jgi:hypothetical protein
MEKGKTKKEDNKNTMLRFPFLYLSIYSTGTGSVSGPND